MTTCDSLSPESHRNEGAVLVFFVRAHLQSSEVDNNDFNKNLFAFALLDASFCKASAIVANQSRLVKGVDAAGCLRSASTIWYKG